jgi:glycosyltransferase involved in cell wall biosynthesis
MWGDEKRIGVGGAELYMLTLAEGLHNAGHNVVLYNDPFEFGASKFEQRAIASFKPTAKRDILIVFRSPNAKAIVANGYKIWLSCDQYTLTSFSKFAKTVDRIICISPFHVQYFKDTYDIQNAEYIDIPVRTEDYDVETYDKVEDRVIFTSVPGRGLMDLLRMWPKIVSQVPTATLVVTSDYRLWGSGASNEEHRVVAAKLRNIKFLGAVPRSRLIMEQLKAQITLYPCNYGELFCITIAESQYAGAYPITSNAGALRTTNMGTIIPVDTENPANDHLFITATVNLLNNKEELAKEQKRVHELAKKRFSWPVILKQWEGVFADATSK